MTVKIKAEFTCERCGRCVEYAVPASAFFVDVDSVPNEIDLQVADGNLPPGWTEGWIAGTHCETCQ